MNDLIPSARVEGEILFHGENLYADYVDPVEVRRRIGMVFQKANPFPKSIYDNIAFGPRITGWKGDMDQLVEGCLRRAALWNEVQDKLGESGLALSGGQQQRLCIARAIATEPDVILMDEPCSALDPRSTLQIEELMAELKEKYTIVIVTHNMQQAARASDYTVFLNMDDDRAGYVVEEGPTAQIFTNPRNQDDRGLRVRALRLSGRRQTVTERDSQLESNVDRHVEQILREVEGDIPAPVVPLPRRPLDNEERTIKDILLRMGSLIEERIRQTVEALQTHDDAKALAVIEGDAEINALQEQAMDHIVLAIATQQPVARDLRFLLALDRIGGELERIGDMVANVAKRARELAPEPPLEGNLGIPEMGGIAAQFLADTIRALVDNDAAAAREVATHDDEIDALYHRTFDRLLELAKASPDNVDRAMRLLIAARYMERVGDHITNIAEDVVFVSSGEREDLNP